MGGVVSKNFFFFLCSPPLYFFFCVCVLVQPNSAHTEPYNLRLVVLLLFGQVTIWNRATISSRGPQKLFFHNKQQSLLVKRERGEKKISYNSWCAKKKSFGCNTWTRLGMEPTRRLIKIYCENCIDHCGRLLFK